MENDKYVFSLNRFADRLATFTNWPFKSGCKCTPKKMAEAGFFYCPTDLSPDVVQCFMCLKELDGWEPTDDPWKEHKAHSKDCEHLSGITVENGAVADFIKIEMYRQKWVIKRAHEKKLKEFQAYAQEARAVMESL